MKISLHPLCCYFTKLIVIVLLFTANNKLFAQTYEFTLPANIDKVTFSIAGAQGGSARVKALSTGDYSRASGGLGAKITAQFNVGTGANKIPDGSKIRTIEGRYGEGDLNKITALGIAIATGGGGGGTAVLYQAPGTSTWVLLLAAGGGGGAYIGFVLDAAVDVSSGKHGEFTNNGSSGYNSSAGSGGINGGGGGAGGIRAGGGGGSLSNGSGNVSCSGTSFGAAGFPSGGIGGINCYRSGGFGFGGGGAGYLSGGGGGGYSGGGGGGNTGGGGGGGSYISPMHIAGSIQNSEYSGLENGYVLVDYVLDTPCTDQAITNTGRTVKNVSCKGGKDGAATVSYTSTSPSRTLFAWTPNISSANGAGRSSVTGLSAGTYNCKIYILTSTGEECTFKNVEVIIKEPQEALSASAGFVQNISCNGLTNGEIGILADGGTSPYTYSWTPGNPVGDGTQRIINLAAGTFNCAVEDSKGCTVNILQTITQPPAIDFTLNTQINPSCNGLSNGSVFINTPTGGPANSAINYQWSRKATPNVIIKPINSILGSRIDNLDADTYTCLITIGGCTKSKDFVVTEPEELIIGGNTTPVTCPGLADGSINISAQGGTSPFTYDWNVNTYDGQTSLSNLAPASYSCTVTDNLGCNAIKSFTVTSPAAFSARIDKINSECETPTGSAVATISGGNGGNTFAWENDLGTTNKIQQVPPGTYKLVVTDVKGCIFNTSVTLGSLTPLPDYTATVTPAACFGTATGSAELVLPEETQFISAKWYKTGQLVALFEKAKSGSTDASLKNALAGDYKLVIDGFSFLGNGFCDKTINVTITQPTAITVPTNLSTGSTIINGPQTITLTATGCAGTLNWYNTVNNSLLPNNKPTVLGGESFYVKCKEGQCESAKSASVQIKNNDLCINPISITSAPGVLIPNFPIQSMAASSASGAAGGIDGGSNCNFLGTVNAKDLWYTLTTNSATTMTITIQPTQNSTGNLMGAAIYDGCNGAQLACISNNGFNSNVGFTLKVNSPTSPTGRVATILEQSLLLRVWEFSPFDPINFAPSGTFTISSSFTPLPINVASFKGKSYEKGNLLTWITSAETNFSHFEIERSLDAKAFEKIGSQQSNESKIYEFLDENSQFGSSANYYRLKMMDRDGSFAFSKTIVIQKEMASKITVSPNPTENYLTISGIEASDIQQIMIVDITGKTLKSIKADFTRIQISDLASGMYFLKIAKRDNSTESIKIMKQ